MIKLSNLLNESQDEIYHLDGVLITDGAIRNQKDILSDIRSLLAVTIVRSIDMENDPTSKYDRTRIEVKIDPYPYSKQENISKEVIAKKVSESIRKVPGVIGFRSSDEISATGI
jgi:hypothetical protein